MADDFDVEALLEAPFKKEMNGEVIVFCIFLCLTIIFA